MLQPDLESSYVEALEELGKQAIPQESGGEPQEIRPWQRLKFERRRQRGKRQPDADRHDGDREQHDGHRGGALQKWNLLRTDHVDDERLRQQALNEPAGLEERLAGLGVRAKGKPQDEKGGDVENGTDGADEEHEGGDGTRVPL